MFKPVMVKPNPDDINFGEEIAGKISKPALLREAGLEKTRVLKKTSPVGFFGFLGFFFFFWFFGFFGFFKVFGFFFYIFAQKREFLGFFQFQEYFYVHPDF